MPQSVRYAIYAIWAEFAIGIPLAIIDWIYDDITTKLLVITLIIFAILVIFPYKLSKKSNPARYIWLVLSVLSFLSTFGGTHSFTRFSDIGSLITLPLPLLEIYWLFTRESNIWFGKKEFANET